MQPLKQTVRRLARIAQFILVLGIGVTWWMVARSGDIPAEPKNIIRAILAGGKESKSDEVIIRAIKRFGDSNGNVLQSGSGQPISFLAAATSVERRQLVDWLLDNGADANPAGENPLMRAIERDDLSTARKLLRAGSRWDIKLENNMTVDEWARLRRPKTRSLLQR